jgi:Flp pilus assembly protein TadG
MSHANRHRLTRLQRGAAAVEFALMLLFLVPLTIGVVETGRALYAYDTLAKSVRSAARYLATVRPNDAADRQRATCLAVTGSIANTGGSCNGTPLLNGLTTGMVTILEPSSSNEVRLIATGSGTIDMVTVAISGYPLSTLGSAIFPNLTLGTISMTVPYVFF